MGGVRFHQRSQDDRFSVVIPAFNAAAYLPDALQSLACAHGLERLDQIIVVDDASQDDTADVARSVLASLKLPGQVVRSGINLGVGRARRLGFAYVQSPVIACVDADDCCEPNRFVDPLRLLRNPDVMLVGGDMRLWADAPIALRQDGARIKMPTRADAIAAALLFFCPVYGGICTFRRALLQKIDAPVAAIGEDWLMAHRVVQTFGGHAVANTGTVLARYRRHANQLTQSSSIDSTNVLPLWRGILEKTLALDISTEELALHAKFSPLSFKQTPVPTGAELQRWEVWAKRLQAAANHVGYVPATVASQIETITHDLRKAFAGANRHPYSQMPTLEQYELGT